jgi:CheY-like chemotaxis protein
MFHPTLLSLETDLWCSGPPTRPGEPAVAPGSPVPDRSAPLRVLIVEDEVMIAMTLESMVEDFGHEVGAVVSTGEEAISQALVVKPDVILMDVNLGAGIDGVEAARRTRQALDARIVFVTAYADAATMARMHAAIPDALVVNKPFDSESLRRAIQGTARQ